MTPNTPTTRNCRPGPVSPSTRGGLTAAVGRPATARRPPSGRPPGAPPGASRRAPPSGDAARALPGAPAAPPARRGGRRAAAGARRNRRSLTRWGSVLVVAVAIGVGIWLLVKGNSGPARPPDAI